MGQDEQSGSSAASGKILLVEDDQLCGDMIEDMLAEIGYAEVVRAETIEDALKQLQAGRPDLVVLDASLRGVAAHTVAAQLKDNGIPFVVSTGYDPEKLPDAFRHGVPLKKPYDRQALITALRAARPTGKRN